MCINFDELRIKNDEFCIKNDELGITNDEFCIQNCLQRSTPWTGLSVARRIRPAAFRSRSKKTSASPQAISNGLGLYRGRPILVYFFRAVRRRGADCEVLVDQSSIITVTIIKHC